MPFLSVQEIQWPVVRGTERQYSVIRPRNGTLISPLPIKLLALVRQVRIVARFDTPEDTMAKEIQKLERLSRRGFLQ